MEQDGRTKGKSRLGRRGFLKATAAMGGAFILGNPASIWAQAQKRISVATGGMGGVYYPLGGGIAAVISKYVPNVEAAAEVTAASVDNCKLIAAKKSDLAIVMGDVVYDAWSGAGKFKEKLPVRCLGVLYSNLTQIVARAGKGINKVSDLKGKSISTGAPGSGVEVIALRVLEAAGVNPDKDAKRDRLGATESAGAMKDGKLDAYFWCGGVPTASILDLAATPGMKISFVPNGDLVSKMTGKYGPVYFETKMPKGSYPGVEQDVSTSAVANLLIAHEAMDEKLVYDILAAMFDHKAELVAVHKEAQNIDLKSAIVGSPIPFHKGAIKYFKDKGLDIKT
jgi:TRAP transporter TAXI family solute receptor